MRDLLYPPFIGDWYRNLKGELFEVVALDEEEGVVEIQYFDGSLEEFDLDSWNDIHVEPVEQPEDWSGPLDIEREDYGVDLDEPPSSVVYHTLDRIE